MSRCAKVKPIDARVCAREKPHYRPSSRFHPLAQSKTLRVVPIFLFQIFQDRDLNYLSHAQSFGTLVMVLLWKSSGGLITKF